MHSIQDISDCPYQVQHFISFTVYFVNVVSGSHVISIAPQSPPARIIDSGIPIINVVPTTVFFGLSWRYERDRFFRQAWWTKSGFGFHLDWRVAPTPLACPVLWLHKLGFALAGDAPCAVSASAKTPIIFFLTSTFSILTA